MQHAPMRVEARHHKIQNLKKIHRDLLDLGFTLSHIKSLKPKHIQALVSHWQARSLSVGRMKNLLADLRYVADACGKANIIQKNAAYGIGARSSVPTHNRALFLPDFSKIDDKSLYLSLQLQRVFGFTSRRMFKKSNLISLTVVITSNSKAVGRREVSDARCLFVPKSNVIGLNKPKPMFKKMNR